MIKQIVNVSVQELDSGYLVRVSRPGKPEIVTAHNSEYAALTAAELAVTPKRNHVISEEDRRFNAARKELAAAIIERRGREAPVENPLKCGWDSNENVFKLVEPTPDEDAYRVTSENPMAESDLIRKRDFPLSVEAVKDASGKVIGFKDISEL